MRFVTIALFSLISLAARAEDSPQELSLYELGAGMGAAWFAHYPGSDQERLFAVPFPYFIYRGQILRSSREEGTRARFLHGKDYEISLSAGGAFPVSSENNIAREGMPDLGWILELGPKLRISLIDFEGGGNLRFGLAARGALTSRTAWTVEHHGMVYEMEFALDRKKVIFDVLDLRLELSSRFATEGYMSYLYQVPIEHARANRPQYNAEGGYLYSTLGAGLGYRTEDNDHRIVLFGTIDSLAGTSNSRSPLIKTHINTTVAIAYITVFHRSEAKAPTD